MYYLINPLSWPFTVIPNLPPNLFEVIDSPIPLLIGVLGNKDSAEEINKMRNGNCNLIIINNNDMTYHIEELSQNHLFGLLIDIHRRFNVEAIDAERIKEELKRIETKKRQNQIVKDIADSGYTPEELLEVLKNMVDNNATTKYPNDIVSNKSTAVEASD